MRRLAMLLALCGLTACGDNLLSTADELTATGDLVVVAHQDDDLLFMQPDILEAVRRGQGVTTVYVTAGNGTKGVETSDKRYDGLRSAYGAAAGSTDWHCGILQISGHTAEHCRLRDRNVSLVFLGYPDGGKMGEYSTSLLHLWEGTIDGATTIAHDTTFYDRDALIDTVTQIVRLTQPAHVHTLDISSTHGRDHSDHMLVGALTTLALARANSAAELLSYRGYDIADEPVNKLPPIFDEAFDVLAHYEACISNCGACGDACTAIDQTHVTWLERRYAIGFRRAAGGRLHNSAGCLYADGSIGSCGTAPLWQLDEAGELRTVVDERALCLDVSSAGELAVDACLGGPAHRFFADDEGHLWSGVPPTPAAAMDYAHLWCLAPADTRATVQLCGADAAPTWEFAPLPATTTRADLGLAATGREVRLGDITGDGKADLCAVENGRLSCATGDGEGHFVTALQVDDASAPLAIDPRSLTLGDVDGDGRIDACGRDANGVLCATAAHAFASERWSPSFSDNTARPSTSASLAAIDANGDGVADVCGVDATGVICAPHGLTLQAQLRSAWPAANDVVWPADLDGDGQADWCAATDNGPACAVEAQRDLTTDGAAWGYAMNGTVDVAPATSATVALADIDGDGRADLCAPHEDRIVCARSQGRAFGPRSVTLAILPNQATASALWLGDLDGDGRADACVDSGTDIVCAVDPQLP